MAGPNQYPSFSDLGAHWMDRGGESLSQYLMFQVYLAAQRGACTMYGVFFGAPLLASIITYATSTVYVRPHDVEVVKTVAVVLNIDTVN